MQTPGIFNSQDSETVVLQSSANKISKSSKYLGDDMIPVLFLMFYLVSILTFGLKSTLLWEEETTWLLSPRNTARFQLSQTKTGIVK